MHIFPIVAGFGLRVTGLNGRGIIPGEWVKENTAFWGGDLDFFEKLAQVEKG